MIPQKETPVLHPMQQTRSGKPPSLRNWLRYISPQTSISNKIFWGYGISLGVAFLGVSGGLIVGNHYQQEARSQLRNTQEQGILLSQLQVTMSDFQPEREFVPNVRNIERFHVARTQFFQRVSRIELLLNKLRNTVSLEELKTLEPFLVAFETTVQSYTEELEIILQTIQPEAVQPQEIPVLEETFHEFANGPTYLVQ